MLTKKDKIEGNNKINSAVENTEDFLYNEWSSQKARSKKLAKVFINERGALQIKLPRDNLGVWVQNKYNSYLNLKL